MVSIILLMVSFQECIKRGLNTCILFLISVQRRTAAVVAAAEMARLQQEESEESGSDEPASEDDIDMGKYVQDVPGWGWPGRGPVWVYVEPILAVTASVPGHPGRRRILPC